MKIEIIYTNINVSEDDVLSYKTIYRSCGRYIKEENISSSDEIINTKSDEELREIFNVNKIKDEVERNIDNAKLYLSSTDYYFLSDNFFSLSQDEKLSLIAKRQEKRKYIEDNINIDIEVIKLNTKRNILLREQMESEKNILFKATMFKYAESAIEKTLVRIQGIPLTEPLPMNDGKWDNADNEGISFTVKDLWDLRNSIYDRAAYNYGVRKLHITNMEELQTIEAVKSYDYSTLWQ